MIESRRAPGKVEAKEKVKARGKGEANQPKVGRETTREADGHPRRNRPGEGTVTLVTGNDVPLEAAPNVPTKDAP